MASTFQQPTMTSSVTSAREATDAAVDALSCDIGRVTSLRRQARAANGHMMDPEKDGLVRLELEHDEITKAMEATLQAALVYQKAAPQQRTQEQADRVNFLLDQTIQLIVQHASLEEQHVYPLFGSKLKDDPAHGWTAKMIYERNVVDDDVNKRMLDLLLMMKCERDCDLMISTIKKFQIVEEEHLCQEEKWFALLRSSLTTTELSDLAAKMRTTGTPTRPHSLVGPSHGLAARISHPVAGLVDRAVDAVTKRAHLTEDAHGVKTVNLQN